MPQYIWSEIKFVRSFYLLCLQSEFFSPFHSILPTALKVNDQRYGEIVIWSTISSNYYETVSKQCGWFDTQFG